MQNVTWLSFALSTAMTKTIVHFFPSAGSITAPYTAQCRLTLFGSGIDQSSVILEGARMSQPDGVRLSDAFPSVNDQPAALYGLEIELAGSQPRLDLSNSSVVVEFRSKSHSVRFHPLCLSDLSDRSSQPFEGIYIKDPFASTSVIVVNNSTSTKKPNLSIRRVNSDGSHLIDLPTNDLSSGGVIEVQIDSDKLDTKAVECSWGMTRSERIVSNSSLESGMFAFVLHRDSVSKQPIGVFAI